MITMAARRHTLGLAPLLTATALLTTTLAVASDPSGIPDATPVSTGQKLPLSPRRGLVILERGGRPVASGVVLDGDGRVITGLRTDTREEGVGTKFGSKALDVIIRYGDGSRAPGKIMHADSNYGLALVVPMEGKRQEGLRASDANSERALVHVMDAAAPKPALLEAFSGRYLLPASIPGLMTLLEPARTPSGTAILDDAGAVAGMTVNVCGQAPLSVAASSIPAWAPLTCDIHAVAPVAAIRMFLASVPKSAVAPAAWLGIAGQPTDTGVRGVRVVAVAKGSPGAAAGLRGDNDPAKADIVNSVDGEPVSSPEELAGKLSTHAVGDRVKLLVLHGKSFREVTITLRAAP
jgi:serine protease Do